VRQIKTERNNFAQGMPARKKAEFVPRIAQGDFASVIGIRGFLALHLFDEKSKEST
jgi:hypothetical protein